MKMNFRKCTLLVILFLGGLSVQAQSFSSILKSAAGEVASTAKNSESSIVSGLTSIFNASKVATVADLVGTWKYTEPAIVFKSSNLLKNAGGKLAAAAIEKKMQTQFAKLGIKKGQMSMVFDKSGNFTQTIGKKKIRGTYSLSGQNISLKYAGLVSQVGTTQVDGNNLLFVMDASKLLKYAKSIGALTGNSTLNSLGSLVSSYEGMQVGFRFNK